MSSELVNHNLVAISKAPRIDPSSSSSSSNGDAGAGASGWPLSAASSPSRPELSVTRRSNAHRSGSLINLRQYASRKLMRLMRVGGASFLLQDAKGIEKDLFEEFCRFLILRAAQQMSLRLGRNWNALGIPDVGPIQSPVLDARANMANTTNTVNTVRWLCPPPILQDLWMVVAAETSLYFDLNQVSQLSHVPTRADPCRYRLCLPVCLPVCLSICLSVCLSACLPVCLSVCLSAFFCGISNCLFLVVVVLAFSVAVLCGLAHSTTLLCKLVDTTTCHLTNNNNVGPVCA
jgi:hypothetical protein